ncbi:hypothetical protein [Micromonospora sp. 4G55]|uniref:hypothetical protein n=1 Tax=Micromonospora sp. 4G55 TaxID=2806102 RepID=UPI001A6226A5|nr:hypothetical protein [Micromonospora sp. 4G55]MBM0258008.1 hypothetical protein [Micromonospora sp. 4G55]MBM0260825.1 hypothetical protein [Micromonospora sp. 4G55]
MNRAGTVSLGQHLVLAAEIPRGRRVGIRIEPATLMFFDLDTRQLLRTRPNPLTPADISGCVVSARRDRHHSPRPARSGSSGGRRTPAWSWSLARKSLSAGSTPERRSRSRSPTPN